MRLPPEPLQLPAVSERSGGCPRDLREGMSSRDGLLLDGVGAGAATGAEADKEN